MLQSPHKQEKVDLALPQSKPTIANSPETLDDDKKIYASDSNDTAHMQMKSVKKNGCTAPTQCKQTVTSDRLPTITTIFAKPIMIPFHLKDNFRQGIPLPRTRQTSRHKN